LGDPSANEGSGIVWPGNIDRFAVATELKGRFAGVSAHIAEYPLHRCEVRVRRETDLLRPRSKIAQQPAGITWVERDHWRPGIRRVHVDREEFAIDRFEHHILDAQTENVDQERT